MKACLQYLHTLLIGTLLLSVASGCDVHEFPQVPEPLPENATFNLQLRFATDMPQWEYPITESRTFVPSRVVQEEGEMRYIIRVYPGSSSSRTPSSRGEAVREFEFTRDVSEGYNADFQFDVPVGDYTIMAWADLAENIGDAHLYDANEFSQIKLQGGEHRGNNDYRDGFRGMLDVSFSTADVMANATKTVVVDMARPMAKFEFITTDIDEFIGKEIEAALSRGEITPEAVENAPSKAFDMSKYKIMFYYVGFMPNTFNMFTDKPSNSVTGISFPGRFMRLEGNEASLGFDYVFVNGTEVKVAVQIGIFDEAGNQLSMTAPIDVPLRRSQHTLIKGRFMMQNASGGVGVDPSFSGDHNIFI